MFMKPGRSRIWTDLQTPEGTQAPSDPAVGSSPAASDGRGATAGVITNAADELPFLRLFLLLLLPSLQRPWGTARATRQNP